MTKKNSEFKCKICNQLFIRERRTQVYCNDQCSQTGYKIRRSVYHARWRSKPENKRKMRIAESLYRKSLKMNNPIEYKIKSEFKSIKGSLKASTKRNNIKEIEQRLSLFGEGICCFCNSYKPLGPDRTIEHLLPVTSGGDNSCNNLYNSCRDCNESKWHYEWKSWYRDQPFYSQSREKEIEKFNNVDWKNYMVTSGIHYF